uniref:Glycosyltransferase 2-like domain-containing protein n=1 Tax=Helicotheca tamesis TaxID=374047 RepID=A0A7S2E073_9STRA
MPPAAQPPAARNNVDPNNEQLDVIVFTTTFFKSPSDLRCRVALSTLRSLARLNIPAVVIDASPLDSGVIESLQSVSNMHVVKHQSVEGGKGAALREALSTANTVFRGRVTGDTWLAFQEPEKANMAPHWHRIFRSPNSAVKKETGVVVPQRADASFQRTYPIEQYHSELFGNMFLDSVARKSLIASSSSQQLPPSIDWLFGPFALRNRHSNLWLNYDGMTYDAQIVPLIRAMRLGNVGVQSIPIDFEASKDMKAMEEGNGEFIEKRFHQLFIWEGLVHNAWTENFDVSSSPSLRSGVGAAAGDYFTSLNTASVGDPLSNQMLGMMVIIMIGITCFFFNSSRGKFFHALNTHRRTE